MPKRENKSLGWCPGCSRLSCAEDGAGSWTRSFRSSGRRPRRPLIILRRLSPGPVVLGSVKGGLAGWVDWQGGAA